MLRWPNIKLYLSELQDPRARVNTDAELHTIQGNNVQTNEVLYQHQGGGEDLGHEVKAEATVNAKNRSREKWGKRR